MQYLEARFFPEAAPNDPNARNVYTLITMMTYVYRVEIFRSLQSFDYIRVFEYLANYGLTSTPLPLLIDEAEISALR